MRKVIYTIVSFLKYLLILWLPILLIEETFLLDYVNSGGSLVCSLFLIIICLIVYIKSYKKTFKDKVNCYIYNIVNTLLLVIINLALGSLFYDLVDSKIFHYCTGSGWDCFLYGFEYIFIGIEYAFFAIVALIVWLFVRFIKFLISKKNNKIK